MGQEAVTQEHLDLPFMKWLDSTNALDAAASEAAFWNRLRSDLQSGNFWFDRAAAFRDKPVERLRLAIDNRPLPAAFEQAAIALRAVIRGRISSEQDFTEPLGMLYWLAAIESFGVPYPEYLQQPGFNVLRSVPGDVIRSLPFTYSSLGYRHLSLLKKTDIKWCVAAWGEPLGHTTLNIVHLEIWRKYEAAEKLRQERARSEMRGLADPT